MGANDLGCWRALKYQISTHEHRCYIFQFFIWISRSQVLTQIDVSSYLKHKNHSCMATCINIKLAIWTGERFADYWFHAIIKPATVTADYYWRQTEENSIHSGHARSMTSNRSREVNFGALTNKITARAEVKRGHVHVCIGRRIVVRRTWHSRVPHADLETHGSCLYF